MLWVLWFERELFGSLRMRWMDEEENKWWKRKIFEKEEASRGNILRIAKAALHKLPGKSSLNVRSPCPVCPLWLVCPVYPVCPGCPVCPDDHDDDDDSGDNDDRDYHTMMIMTMTVMATITILTMMTISTMMTNLTMMTMINIAASISLNWKLEVIWPDARALPLQLLWMLNHWLMNDFPM